jgi:hypothetical protein
MPLFNTVFGYSLNVSFKNVSQEAVRICLGAGSGRVVDITGSSGLGTGSLLSGPCGVID